jgi:hypothetical protein
MRSDALLPEPQGRVRGSSRIRYCTSSKTLTRKETEQRKREMGEGRDRESEREGKAREVEEGHPQGAERGKQTETLQLHNHVFADTTGNEKQDDR